MLELPTAFDFMSICFVLRATGLDSAAPPLDFETTASSFAIVEAVGSEEFLLDNEDGVVALVAPVRGIDVRLIAVGFVGEDDVVALASRGEEGPESP